MPETEKTPRWQQWIQTHGSWSASAEHVNVPIYALNNLLLAHDNAEQWIKKQQAALVASCKEKGELLERIATMGKQLDALLEHCPDAECSTCATIICPHGEPFHFHHDGWPACAEDPRDDDSTYAPAP